MALTQFDILKSLPYPALPSGRYYWTTVAYVDSDDWSNQNQMILHVLQRERLITRANVRFDGYTIKRPPGRGNIILQADPTPAPNGSLAAVADPQIISIARWTLRDNQNHPTYRLVRYPLGTEDIDADMLSASGYARQVASLNTFLATGTFRSKYGRVLTAGTVSPRVHMWQLRHGTKRSRSTFWL